MASAHNADQDFVEYIVKAIVTEPEKVVVDRTIDEMGVLISLQVGAEDMGKIIGKEGRTAKAIRTLLRVVGAKENARVNLKILEPEGGRVMPEKPAPTEEPAPAVEVVSEKKSRPTPIAEEPTQEIPEVPADEEEKATELI